MENYLLGKTNRLRPSRSLYDNPFRNDNSYPPPPFPSPKVTPTKIVTDAMGVTIVVRPYSGT